MLFALAFDSGWCRGAGSGVVGQDAGLVVTVRSGEALSKPAGPIDYRMNLQPGGTVKITVEKLVDAPLEEVWNSYNDPADIRQWNTAQDDWHTTAAAVDLREGGRFVSRMEAKDGSAGFDFEGTYTRIVPHREIAYRMSDGREVEVEFAETAGGVHVRVRFDAESENRAELQQHGWQAILDSFGRHVEAKQLRH